MNHMHVVMYTQLQRGTSNCGKSKKSVLTLALSSDMALCLCGKQEKKLGLKGGEGRINIPRRATVSCDSFAPPLP
jgi:hypothetical protein